MSTARSVNEINESQEGEEREVEPSETETELQSRTEKSSGKPPLPPNRKRKMKSRSEVWDHFSVFHDDNGEKLAQCNYCPKSYFCDSKKCGTSTLLDHMKKCMHNPLNKKSDSRQTEICMVPSGDGGSVISNWKFDPIVARRKLVLMIIKDEFAFSIVDGEGFIEFVGYLQPKFKIPSRWTISRDIYQIFLEEKLKLREYFKTSKTTVCITTDTWTSQQKVNYMCITAHYVDVNWVLNKKIINFSLVEGHKGEEMSRQIDGCLRDWGIARVLAITVDNASANDKCIDYLRERLNLRGCLVGKGVHLHMRCAAHIVNLIVMDGLKIINPSIKRVRNAVRFVKHSPARSQRFKDCAEDENIDCKSLLCLDVPTRWNSTYLMLSVATKFEKAFERFEVEDPHFKAHLSYDKEVEKGEGGVPTRADWEVARKISDILRVFYEITLKVSASLTVTSNLLFHEIDIMVNLLRDWVSDNHDVDCHFIKQMGLMMQMKLEKYWGNAREMNKLIFLPVILDPRYKLKFVSFLFKDEYGDEEGEKLIFDLQMSLLDLFEFYKNLKTPSQSQSGECQSLTQSGVSGVSSQSLSSNSVSSHSKKQRLSRTELFIQSETQSGGSVIRTELDIFLKEETLSTTGPQGDFNILKWWEAHQSRFPILSLVARDIMAMPISTVSSESAFSTGGRILDPFRSSLTPKIVEGLVCTQNWLRKSNKPIEHEEDLISLLKHEEGIFNVDTMEKDNKGKSKEI